MNNQISMIKFKLTSGNQQPIQLAYEENKKIGQYMEDLGQLFDVEPLTIKLVYKGKVLTQKQTASQCKIEGGTVMTVINSIKKQQKKTIPSKDQIVPGAGISTGLGSANMGAGFGGYEIVNHPQYMSAISQAVDPDKMEQLMNDPQTQGMIQQMLDDPDTLISMMNQNPMTQQMIKNNPMLKQILKNPAMRKMLFSKQMIKKAQQMSKNGGFQNIGAMNNMFSNPQTTQSAQPFSQFPAFNNPNIFSQIPPTQSSIFNTLNHPNPQVSQAIYYQTIYRIQIKQLQQYGFTNKQKIIKALIQTNGNVDLAMQKLCSQ